MSDATSPDGVTFDLDMGDGHGLHWVTHQGCDGRHTGAIVYHRKADGTWCEGPVFWERHYTEEAGRPTWTLHGQADAHLTLSPSILCRLCGDHGYIRDGKWIRA